MHEDTRSYGDLTPVDALSLMGEELRAGILWTLAEARGGRGNPPAIPFAELRRRVAPDVDSSRFNYHLQRLVGHLVERRGDGDPHPINEFTDRAGNFATRGDGYALSPAGRRLLQAVRAGTTDGDPDVPAFETGYRCHHCGTALEATYRRWLAAVRCPGCRHLYEYNMTPPGVVTDARDEVDGAALRERHGTETVAQAVLLERVAGYNRHVRAAGARGVCAVCGAGLDHRFIDPAAVNYPRGDRRVAMVERACGHCGNMDYLTAGELVLPEPAVIAHCHAHGEDITRTPAWALGFAATDRHTTVQHRDPWRVTVRVTRGSELLTCTVDDDLAVQVDRDA